MPKLSSAVVGVAVLAVAGVLVFGLINMLRQGSANRSQTLMRWRVGVQAFAIALIVAVLYLRRH